jgi:hypothetical protein
LFGVIKGLSLAPPQKNQSQNYTKAQTVASSFWKDQVFSFVSLIDDFTVVGAIGAPVLYVDGFH